MEAGSGIVISEQDLNISVRFFNNSYNPHTTITIEPRNGTIDMFRAITYNYNGSTATDEKYLGHVTTEWKSNDGVITYRYQGCYIPGYFDPKKLSISIVTQYNNFTISHFDVEVIEDPTIGLPRRLLILFTILIFLGMFAVSGFKMILIAFGGIR